MALAGLDEVRVIPAAIPPHRQLPCATSSERVDMIQMALADESGMTLDTREIQRPGQSYTVDTVRELRAEFPQMDFSLVLGLDAVLELDQWHQWEDLLSLVPVIAMVRPGYSMPKPLPPWWHHAEGPARPPVAGRIHPMAISPLDISATRIRTDLRTNSDVRHLLHPDVYDYIVRHDLYSANPRTRTPDMKKHGSQPVPDTRIGHRGDVERMLDTIRDALEEGHGQEIVVLDVTALTDVCDCMVVVSGTSDRQIKTLADKVLEKMHAAGWRQIGLEGEEAREWVLVDFVDVVVHIMRREARQRYDLESLWDQTFGDLQAGRDSNPHRPEGGASPRDPKGPTTQAETGIGGR